MSDCPHLLFLHGVGDGDLDERWKTALEGALAALGYPDLSGIDVIAPRYAHALKGWDERKTLPPVSIHAPTRDAAKQHRRDFERRMAAVEYRISSVHNPGQGWAGAAFIVDNAIDLPQFVQARNYVRDTQVRAQVLRHILSQLPEEGSIVFVAHSLGSVIAADLILRLSPKLRVVGVITIGSPLASGAFSLDGLPGDLKEPPANVEWWINFWNPADPVSSHRGLSSKFPWLIDFRVDSGTDPRSAHSAATYLNSGLVADAIGWSLFGSASKELALAESGLDVPLNEVERIGVLAIRYAHLVLPHLKDDVRARVEGALRQVQAQEVEKLRKWRAENDLPLPSLLADLRFDLADPSAAAPVPPPAPHLSVDEALVVLSVLATENVLQPFEIKVTKEQWRSAMSELSAEMGLGSKLGQEVFDRVEEVRAALSEPRKVNWIKWGAIAAGTAAIVVVTGGLALAAAPGVAGAALVTSALASFGPGGMIGGLITAGTLVTAGGGGIAYGLASSQTSAEALATLFERQLTVARLRYIYDVKQDPFLWRNLVETEMQVRRMYERMDEFSEPDAPSIVELRRKISVVGRAIDYVVERNLVAQPTTN